MEMGNINTEFVNLHLGWALELGQSRKLEMSLEVLLLG